jgi:hypothetical protein
MSPALRLAVAALLPLCTGCLVYDRQSLVLITPAKGEKAGKALLVYEGLHSSEASDKDFASTCKQLKQLTVSGERCYAGAWMLPIAVAEPDEKEKESIQDRAERLLYKKNLRIGPATFFTDAGGRLCCYQVVTIPDVPGFLTDLNGFVNLGILTGNLGQQSWLDDASKKQVREAAGNAHAWLSTEPGLLKLNLPLTPAGLAGLKRDVLNPGRFERLVVDLDQLINPKEGKEKVEPEEYKRRIKEIQEDVLLLVNNPVNIDQHKDHVLLALGLGEGQPIELLGPQSHLGPQALEADKKLAEFARTLGRPFARDVTLDALRTRFIQGKLTE